MSPRTILATLVAVGMAAGAGAGAGSASAQDNLDKLGKFRTTGVKDFTEIEQGGEKAERINDILHRRPASASISTPSFPTPATRRSARRASPPSSAPARPSSGR